MGGLVRKQGWWRRHPRDWATGKMAMTSHMAEDSEQRAVCLGEVLWVQAVELFLDVSSSILGFTSLQTPSTHLHGTGNWIRGIQVCLLSSYFELLINLTPCFYSKAISNSLKDSYYAFKIAISNSAFPQDHPTLGSHLPDPDFSAPSMLL